ncbi:sugar phosphate isomerase/epimerase family protein [Rubrobacter indicoceani]|uniref:sugar phosphate isomerase/epimerase family protein n=1 Tax=Rubrobacter indicoceani TaxID=2051957 RepID=UPI000E5BB596|nr:sugar phosphate isomerase/epimerase family protein [Rubrobacter indicoceani]
MKLRYAYNTNGAANHRLEDALEMISASGYSGVALTLDHHHLDPLAPDLEKRSERLARRLGDLGLGIVIETGARFLLDPREKHEPTLISPSKKDRLRRLDFLTRAAGIAAATDAEAVSFWAGVPRPGVSRQDASKWLVEGLQSYAGIAGEIGATIAFEPEPGMLVETLDDFVSISEEVPSLKLALDTGHCLVTGEREPDQAVREFSGYLGTVAVEDMRRGVHEHLPFGEGDMDLEAVLGALLEVGFGGLVCVELSRESHRAHHAVPEALQYLKRTEHALEETGERQ